MFKLSVVSYLCVFMTLSFTKGALAFELMTDLPVGEAKGLVIIAPAKKYLMQERLFTELAKKLSQTGYIAVRFNWSADTLEVPELELQRASDDLSRVIKDSQKKYDFDADKTILISKSFSTKALKDSIALAQTHILLTPNCSPEAPFEKTYDKVLNQAGILLSFIISNEDPYCDIQQIYKTLATRSNRPTFLATHGDHNFILPGQMAYQDQVIQFVTELILSR